MRWLVWLLLLPLRLPIDLVRWLSWRFRPATVLEIPLRGTLSDLPQPAAALSGQPATSLLPVLAALRRAETDPHLRTVLVTVDSFSPGLARAEELRAALARVVSAEKRVVVYAEQLSLATYWAVCSATELVLAPAGALNLSGVASEFTMFRGLLDKLGVQAQLRSRGEYKSARETFTEYNMSEANREMLTALVQDLKRQLIERVASGRNQSAETVDALLAEGPFRASEALKGGLVDRLAYEAELTEPLKEAKRSRWVSSEQYVRVGRRRWLPVKQHRVALLRVRGNIRSGSDSPGRSGGNSTSSNSFVKAVERAAKDKRIRALVLRVDSPGGSALASDIMWRALRSAQEHKPVFVSMANVAASGGYYVSGLPHAKLWASESTITGSIGVVAGKFAVPELLGKLGIRREAIRTHQRATYYSPSTAWTDEELNHLAEDIDALYSDFVAKMAHGRGQSFEQLEAVARGRVWTGLQAKALGLVDEMGGFQEMLDALRDDLGLTADAPLLISDFTRPSWMQSLRVQLRPGLSAALPEELATAFERAQELSDARLLCRMPFDLTFR